MQHKPDSGLFLVFCKKPRGNITQYPHCNSELAYLTDPMQIHQSHPAYKQGEIDDKVYVINLFDLNIQCQLTASHTVLAINMAQVSK